MTDDADQKCLMILAMTAGQGARTETLATLLRAAADSGARADLEAAEQEFGRLERHDKVDLGERAEATARNSVALRRLLLTPEDRDESVLETSVDGGAEAPETDPGESAEPGWVPLRRDALRRRYPA
jgi:hypothetical protein